MVVGGVPQVILVMSLWLHARIPRLANQEANQSLIVSWWCDDTTLCSLGCKGAEKSGLFNRPALLPFGDDSLLYTLLVYTLEKS
jgi:hypothetical protein